MLMLVWAAAFAAEPLMVKEDVFPLNALHNHASSVVELRDGSLLVCWYRGSGERTADDVLVWAARKKRGEGRWSEPFVLADTVGFPDTNPMLFVDGQGRLWLFWNTIVANRWETAILNYKRASNPYGAGAPKWDKEGYIVPKPPHLAQRARAYADLHPELKAHKGWPELEKMLDDKYAARAGWMTRIHPTVTASGRLLVPLYSDGFNFSLAALSDDGGETWFMSGPMVGMGAVQPAIVEKKDGTLVAYMRDNGPPPKRVMKSVSMDEGLTWSFATDEAEPNSGTSVDVLKLPDGRWLMMNNDTEKGRHSLVLAISGDEGATWKWRRHIELDTRMEKPDAYHYPSLCLASDGTIHATYSVFRNEVREGRPRKTIRYARFNAEWVMQGDMQ
jgi:predicted neuraminidase